MALEDHKLPEDVVIGHIRFRKGVSLSVLVNRARAWFEISKDSSLSHTEQAKIIRAMCPDNLD